MRMEYRILWFEDMQSWYESARALLEPFLEDHGFRLVADRYANSEQGITSIVSRKDYDLILMDFALDNTTGDKIIEEIRDEGLYTDIVFYSQSGAQTIRESIRQKGIDGLFCTSRENIEFEEKVTKVIRNTIKKVEDVNNMRGLVIAEAIDLEHQIESILRQVFELKIGSVSFREQLFQDICASKLEQHETYGDKIKEIGTKDIDFLIDNDILTANNLRETLLKMLKAEITGLNITLNSSGRELPNRKQLEDKKDRLMSLKRELINYEEEILFVRNTLAHVQEEKDEHGYPILKSLNKVGSTIVFNNNKYTEIRKNLSKHTAILNQIKQVVIDDKLGNVEVASAEE